MPRGGRKAMVEQILGNFLIKKGYMTEEQLDEILTKELPGKAAVSFIAYLEGLLTEEQVAAIRKLPGADQHFGDVAVDEGYLTDEQVIALLKKQTNGFYAFTEKVIKKGYVKKEQLFTLRDEFMTDTGFGMDHVSDIMSGDVERIVPMFLTPETRKYAAVVTNMVRTITNMVDRYVYIDHVEPVPAFPDDCLISQPMVWEEGIIDGFQEGDGGLLKMCSIFSQEEFTELNEDSIDGAGELLNCANGLFVSSLSRKGVYFELLPPITGKVEEKIAEGSVVRVPIFIKRKKMYLIVGELV